MVGASTISEVDGRARSGATSNAIGRNTPMAATATATSAATMHRRHLVSIMGPTRPATLDVLTPVFGSSSEQHDRNWLVRAQDKLERLRREQRPKQPNKDVVESVRDVLSLLYLVHMKPSRIVAIAEGGISLWFIRDRYKALLEISNDSPMNAAFAEISNGNDPVISEISLMSSHGELIPTLTKIAVSLWA